MSDKAQFEKHYEGVGEREQLAWHHAEPTRMLPPAVAARSGSGTALDLGCGTGSDSVYLAKQGWRVTSIDFMESAIEMSAEYARQEGVELDLLCINLFEWENAKSFDVIVDSGLLHNLRRNQLQDYKKRLLAWLAPDGDFVLAHWESRADHDRLYRGPRRATREQITGLLGPEFVEGEFDRKEARMCQVCEGDRCMHGGEHCRGVGPDVSIAYYWFRRG